METIKVNMNPNPLDVQTIHASQNDNEAREWGFELHNNGEKIDSSSISDQLVFKAYKGGTEQILPENGSTPTTSPFKGDIRYPQGLLSDQEFTYRQSPTEEDGNAKIKSLYGNTLVWNQLIQNGNFADKSNWTEANATFTVNNNIATMVASATYGNIEQILSVKANHMYFATCDIKLTTVTNFNLIQFRPYVGVSIPCVSTTEWQTLSGLFIPTTDATVYYPRITDARASGWDAIQIRNCMVIDLTQMGLGISNPSDFTSLFPLSYYSYNQCSLLSFNGNGIKTVSKNQFDTQVVTTSYAGLTLTKTQGTIRAVYSGGSQFAGFNFYGSPVFTDTFLKGKYRLSFDVKGLDTQWTVGLRRGASFLGGGQARAISNDGHYSFTIDAEANPNCYLSFARTGNKTTAYDVTFSNIQLELGTTETSYTPFEEQTTSLPISTYFPTGMKSAGSVYDELTPRKAITRIGAIDLGTLNWRHRGEVQAGVFSCDVTSDVPYKRQPSINFEVTTYENGGTVTGVTDMTEKNNKTVCLYYSTDNTSNFIYAKNTAYTDGTAFKNAMSGIYLFYELATPTETSFTTASLVTENAEIPLSNDDGTLVGKCTEELSENHGFIDAKIKLAGADGECYSNKLQLHIERSPQ